MIKEDNVTFEEIPEDGKIYDSIMEDDDQDIPEPNISLMNNKAEFSLVKPVYSMGQVFDAQRYKLKSHILEKHLNALNNKNSVSITLRVKPLFFNKLVDILSSFSEIIFIDSEGIFSKDENSTFYFTHVEGNNPISEIPIMVMSNDITNIYKAKEMFKDKFSEFLYADVMVLELSWFFTSNGTVRSCSINEELDDTIFKESYPYIDIESFSERYITSDIPLLILTGPPGTGKTRLIRYFLHKMCEKNMKRTISGIFTSDQHVIEEGEIFIYLLRDDYDVLVLEDIDYNLRPREDGNITMYNLLSTSNGLVSNSMKKKKVILSTNLSNTSKIDSALIRPGRCFDIISTRPLTKSEAEIVLQKLEKEKSLFGNSFTLAELYNDGAEKSRQNLGF